MTEFLDGVDVVKVHLVLWYSLALLIGVYCWEKYAELIASRITRPRGIFKQIPLDLILKNKVISGYVVKLGAKND